MSRIIVTRTIDTPIDLVFPTVADIRRFSQGSSDSSRAEWNAGANAAAAAAGRGWRTATGTGRGAKLRVRAATIESELKEFGATT